METTGELERENARLKEEVTLLTRALAAFESPTNSSATLADEQGALLILEFILDLSMIYVISP
jgi:hypothetical protein